MLRRTIPLAAVTASLALAPAAGAHNISLSPNAGDLNGHFEYFVGSSTAAAVSGYPDITVPAGVAVTVAMSL